MSNKPNSIFRLSSVSGLQLFQLSRYAGFVLTGICFAKLGIAKSEIGRFEYFLLLTGMFSFFWIAGLMNTMLANYPKQTDTDKPKLLFSTFSLLLVMSSVAAIAMILIWHHWQAALFLMLNTVAYMIEYLLFLHDKKKQLIIYGICISLLQILVCVIPAYIYMDTTLSIYGLLILAFIKFSFLLYILSRNTIALPDQTQIRRLAALSLPLILSYLASGSGEYIDGALVKHYFSLADFSVFRYGSRDFPLFMILSATLSMSLIPQVSSDLNTGLRAIVVQSKRYMHLFFPLTMVLILSAPWLYSTFFSPQFEESGRIFAALMLLTITRMVFPQTVLIALGGNVSMMVISIVEMLTNIIASFILAQLYGIMGVVYGTLIAYAVEKALIMTVLHFKHGIPPYRYLPLSTFISYSALTLLTYAISRYI